MKLENLGIKILAEFATLKINLIIMKDRDDDDWTVIVIIEKSPDVKLHIHRKKKSDTRR